MNSDDDIRQKTTSTYGRAEVPYPPRGGVHKFVRRFSVPSSNRLDTDNYGRTLTVYYLDEHSKEGVVEKWASENLPTVNERGSRSLYMSISANRPEFQEAAREVLKPKYPNNGGTVVQSITVCPLCGSDLKGTLAGHLPQCPGR